MYMSGRRPSTFYQEILRFFVRSLWSTERVGNVKAQTGSGTGVARSGMMLSRAYVAKDQARTKAAMGFIIANITINPSIQAGV